MPKKTRKQKIKARKRKANIKIPENIQVVEQKKEVIEIAPQVKSQDEKKINLTKRDLLKTAVIFSLLIIGEFALFYLR